MIDIYGKRYYFFAVSIIIILAGFIGLLVNGLQLDIQFQGGTVMQIEMNDDQFDTSKAEAVVGSLINKKVFAQKLQTYNAKDANTKINLLMLKVAKEDTLTGDQLNNVVEELKKEFNVKPDAQIQIQNVAPFIGAEMLRKGIIAAMIASVLIVIYVWWRFSVMSGLSAAIFANLALLHDALIMFSLYTIFKLPLNESFIAAVLTILGYSINDTIVVYDRIRENTRYMKKVAVGQLINTSIIQTLTRTINTSVTTLLCIVVVFLFASANNIQSIREFSLPLLVGLVSGTYSSIFIASPLWAMWQESKSKRKLAAKPSKA